MLTDIPAIWFFERGVVAIVPHHPSVSSHSG
jgi:hypothetical protein